MKKTLETVKKVFTIIVAVIAVSVMIFTIVSVTTFNRNDRNIFGFKAFIVLSDSMKATDFAAGDLVLVKNVDPTTLQEGDIIAYSSQSADNFGETVTHKIRSKTTDANGNPGFITYGTTTNTDDEIIVTYPYINGKYIGHLPKVGTFFNFLKTVPGYLICILAPFLILIILQGLKTVKLFRQYKREQMEALQAEKDEIVAERKRSEEMMKELLALRSGLATGQVGEAVPTATQVPPAAEIKAEVQPTEVMVETEPLSVSQTPAQPQPIPSVQPEPVDEMAALKAKIAALEEERKRNEALVAELTAKQQPQVSKPTAPIQPEPVQFSPAPKPIFENAVEPEQDEEARRQAALEAMRERRRQRLRNQNQ